MFHGAPSRLIHPGSPLPRWGLTDVMAGGPGGTVGASRIPQSLEAPRHFPWHGAINNDAARPRSDRKVSPAPSVFRRFNIRGMPKFSNSERMLGFGGPGDMGISAAIRRRTLPLGKFSTPARLGRHRHSPALSVLGRGPRGHSRGLENSAIVRGPPALPVARRHQQRRSAPALKQKSERRRLRYFRRFSIRGMLEKQNIYIYIYIYIYI